MKKKKYIWQDNVLDMIIIGAGNLGKLILDQLLTDKDRHLDEGIVFYDEKNLNISQVFDKYKIYNDLIELERCGFMIPEQKYFVAIGNSRRRAQYDIKFKELGINPVNIIASYSLLSSHTIIGKMNYIGYLSGIYHSCCIGYGNIIHAYCKIGHGVQIGSFVNLSANCTLLADCCIGDYTFIGANVLVLPAIKIGRYCYVTAGTIVKSDMNDFETR